MSLLLRSFNAMVLDICVECMLCLADLPILLAKIFWHTLVWLFSWVIPLPKKCVRDKVVLITDAGREFGHALAAKFALEGARLALVDHKVSMMHDDVMAWKHFPRYWSFGRGINRSSVDSPNKGPVTRSFDVSFDVHLNIRVNKHGVAGDFRRHDARCDVTVM